MKKPEYFKHLSKAKRHNTRICRVCGDIEDIGEFLIPFVDGTYAHLRCLDKVNSASGSSDDSPLEPDGPSDPEVA